jgi:hypothetical protein
MREIVLIMNNKLEGSGIGILYLRHTPGKGTEKNTETFNQTK